MCIVPEKTVVINGMTFLDVTNVTTNKKVYNYQEAICKSKGEEVICGSEPLSTKD